jgi:hypothetical protein
MITGYHSGLSGKYEWVLGPDEPERFRVYDGHGDLLEEVLLSSFATDEHGSVPLGVVRRTWYPGRSRSMHAEYTARGKRAEPRPRPATIADLLDKGTRVTDNRYNPPVVYTAGHSPMQDADVAELSAEAADKRPLLRSRREGGTEGAVDREVEFPSEEGHGKRAGAWVNRILLGLAVVLGIAAVCLLWRARRGR